MRKNNTPLHTDRNTRQIWSKLGDLEKNIKIVSNYTNLLKSSVVKTVSVIDGGDAGPTTSYTVSFDVDGGSSVPPQPVLANLTAIEPEVPTKPPFYFEGWYSESELNNLWNFNNPIISDMILYAKWRNPYLIDGDGNIYTTVVIGNQEWSVENWWSTSYMDGTPIPHVTDDNEWGGLSTPAYCWYNNDPSQGYGALYNWWVVDPTNPKQIAPDGWRVPTDADWTALENYMIANGYNWDGSVPEGDPPYGWGDNKIGKAVASNGGEWNSSWWAGHVGNDQGSNNSSGFSALPGGSRYGINFFSVGSIGDWWSATETDATDAWYRTLYHGSEGPHRGHDLKGGGFSVRLVRDISQATYTVTFDSDGGTEIPSQYVTSGSTIDTPPIPEKEGFAFAGFWKQAHHNSVWNFAYDTVLGNTTIFVKWVNTGTGGIVVDADGNVYRTIVIGNQEWIIQNWRCTKYANGVAIPYNSSLVTTPAYCWYNNTADPAFREKYGALYNWHVVNPDNPNPIAPEGWRVPNRVDFGTLFANCIEAGFNYDGTIPEVYDVEEPYINNRIAKALTSNGGEWASSSIVGQVGNDQARNNSTGFSFLPGGARDDAFTQLGSGAHLWSSVPTTTPGADPTAWYVAVNHDRFRFTNDGNATRDFYLGVRLVRDI